MDTDEKRRVILIAGIGIAIVVLIAAAVIALDVRSMVQGGKVEVESAVSKAVYDTLPQTRPRFDEQGEFIEYEEDYQLPPGVDMRGQLERGAAVRGTVGMFHMEGWAIDGRRDEHYLLDFEPLTGGYIWQMTVYKPDRDLLAMTMDSDTGYADFSLLEIKLPEDGIYVVVISGFGEDGEYALNMS